MIEYWNYRVLSDSAKAWVGEVYYDSDGKPIAYTDPSIDTLNWESLDELRNTVRLISLALDKRVLLVVDSEIVGEESNET